MNIFAIISWFAVIIVLAVLCLVVWSAIAFVVPLLAAALAVHWFLAKLKSAWTGRDAEPGSELDSNAGYGEGEE